MWFLSDCAGLGFKAGVPTMPLTGRSLTPTLQEYAALGLGSRHVASDGCAGVRLVKAGKITASCDERGKHHLDRIAT